MLKSSFKGRYYAKAGETITAEGPLSQMSIRVSVPNVTIRNLRITGAETGVSRPAIIDASDSVNLLVEDVVLLGDGKQEQGIYMQNGSGMVVRRSTIGPVGIDRFFDHGFYLNGAKNFLIEDVTAIGPFGAGVQLYSGGATGILRKCELKDSRWGIVAWGSGNVIDVDNCWIHGNRMIENGRGLAIEAASGGIVNYKNSYIWDSEAPGNVAGHPGITNNGGTANDLGGNVFAAPPPGSLPPPSLPPSSPPPPPPTTLGVTLSATPSAGTPPLNGVNLTAQVAGTAQGTINYTFYCNRSDLGTNITTPWSAKFDGQTVTQKLATDLCSYPSVGTYTAKVIAERGGYVAESRTVITITNTPPPPITGPTHNLNCTLRALATPGAIQQLINSLQSGQVGCLEAGTYSENVTINAPNKTLINVSGAYVTLRGNITITSAGSDTKIQNLNVDGSSAVGSAVLTADAARVQIINNNISAGGANRSCILLGRDILVNGSSLVIRNNRIHNCGANGVDAQKINRFSIYDNYIYDVGGRGVVLGADADDNTVRNNIIDGGTGGILLTGSGAVPERNSISSNVIAYNTPNHGIEATHGLSNTVSSNCLFQNQPSHITGTGFSETASVIADPLYVNRVTKDFRLNSGSSCLGKGPQSNVAQ